MAFRHLLSGSSDLAIRAGQLYSEWKGKDLVVRPAPKKKWVITSEEEKGCLLYDDVTRSLEYSPETYQSHLPPAIVFIAAFETKSVMGASITMLFVQHTGRYELYQLCRSMTNTSGSNGSLTFRTSVDCDQAVLFCQTQLLTELTEVAGWNNYSPCYCSDEDERIETWYDGGWKVPQMEIVNGASLTDFTKLYYSSRDHADKSVFCSVCARYSDYVNFVHCQECAAVGDANLFYTVCLTCPTKIHETQAGHHFVSAEEAKLFYAIGAEVIRITSAPVPEIVEAIVECTTEEEYEAFIAKTAATSTADRQTLFDLLVQNGSLIEPFKRFLQADSRIGSIMIDPITQTITLETLPGETDVRNYILFDQVHYRFIATISEIAPVRYKVSEVLQVI